MVVVDMAVRLNGEERFERLREMDYIRDIIKLVKGRLFGLQKTHTKTMNMRFESYVHPKFCLVFLFVGRYVLYRHVVHFIFPRCSLYISTMALRRPKKNRDKEYEISLFIISFSYRNALVVY